MRSRIWLAEIFLGLLAAYLFWSLLLHAQGSQTDRESVQRAQTQMATGRGISTYFAWRQPDQQTWLVVTTYDGPDPRHDSATIVSPDRQHDICIDYPKFDDIPQERVCKSTADVAAWLTGGGRK